MSKMHVVGAQGNTLATCHGFDQTEQGLVIKDKDGEKTGFFPLGEFQCVVPVASRRSSKKPAK
ncbi:hypothetical protein [halophilic archaeon]|uniref:hypothetical protein n=1 Tax=Halomicrococcus sp. SG-WS-1 TaxID=3439057 RepID=UPI0011BDCAAF